jgi:hypothetical protein
MTISLFNGGLWKEPVDVQAKHGSVWSPVSKVWVKDNGVWVEVWASELALTATSAAALDVSTIFGADWGASKNKRLIIPDTETIGPMTIPSGLGGSLIIENAGQIIGAGGAANGGAGGDAITANSSFTLINSGAVRGGGGGGGQGGQGGDGAALQTVREPATGERYNSSTDYFYATVAPRGTIHPIVPTGTATVYWDGVEVARIQAIGYGALFPSAQGNDGMTYYRGSAHQGSSKYPVWREGQTSIPIPGGTGGAGGVGRGYGQSSTNGATGVPGPGESGDGGTGGSGGDYGVAGATGATGANGSPGSPGGAPGAAVNMLAGTLTLDNSGIINGAT